ncbi:MAG: cytochrome c [Gammaproteobacteria bacterium]|nr:cytochrome c [Gammaproteobacteria bacterium]
MMRIYIVIAASVLLAACDKPMGEVGKPAQQVSAPAKMVTPATPMPTRSHDTAQITHGAAVYKQNCAACHGENGEGAANWRQRDANGQFPPPPLNGSGHTWHHPLGALRYTIRNGTKAIGGSMPGWKGKLSDADIDAVIAWFQSKWPERAYIAWYNIDQRARKRK